MAGGVNTIIAFLQLADTSGLNPDVCWPWLGAGKGNGYGHTSRGPAHRVSYEIFYAYPVNAHNRRKPLDVVL